MLPILATHVLRVIKHTVTGNRSDTSVVKRRFEIMLEAPIYAEVAAYTARDDGTALPPPVNCVLRIRLRRVEAFESLLNPETLKQITLNFASNAHTSLDALALLASVAPYGVRRVVVLPLTLSRCKCICTVHVRLRADDRVPRDEIWLQTVHLIALIGQQHLHCRNPTCNPLIPAEVSELWRRQKM
jgi:hypothetical protein